MRNFRNKHIVNTRLANAQSEICEHLYDVDIFKVYDYANKVKIPYSYCKGCETQTPCIVTLKLDACAICGGNKKIPNTGYNENNT